MTEDPDTRRPAPSQPDDEGGAERRRHPRIASSELPQGLLIRIPDRPAISLLDLSPGGALLELPFPLQPQSSVRLELSTPAAELAVQFQLIRCYAAALQDDVRYRAAGAFDGTPRWPEMLARLLAPSGSNRLLATLEGLLRASQGAANPISRGIGFHELLAWVVGLLRRGESANQIATQFKAQLIQLFPRMSISPVSAFSPQDTAMSARFFGVHFRSNSVLTASDRRFLRSLAQLITVIDKEAEPHAMVAPHDAKLVDAAWSPIVRTMAEWQALPRNSNAR